MFQSRIIEGAVIGILLALVLASLSVTVNPPL